MVIIQVRVQELINPEHNLLLQVALCPDHSSPVALRVALLLRRTRSLQWSAWVNWTS